MKYFTPDWWAGEVDDMMAPMEEYQRYLDSIRPYLSQAMVALQDKVSLHDSSLRDLVVDVENRLLTLVLDGQVDPWSAEPVKPRRFTIYYHRMRSFQIKTSERTSLLGTDLGYQEIERLDNGMFEHRLLFASGVEFIVQFSDLHLQYVDLQEPAV